LAMLATLPAAVFAFRSETSAADMGRFDVHNGFIEVAADKKLRMTVFGEVKSGDPVTVGNCLIQANEKFVMANDSIRLFHNPTMCINAKGGVYQGAEVSTYPCNVGGVQTDNEQFVFGKDGRIRAKTQDHLCFNINEGKISHGTGLALYACGKEESHKHDVFGFTNHSFYVKSNPKLRLHAQDLLETSNIMLGGCDHDTFDFDYKTKQIMLRGTDLCINAGGGIGAGAPLVVWQCTEPGKTTEDNEKFQYDEDSHTIVSLKDTSLSFNIKEANIAAGSPIVLLPTVIEDML